MSEVLVERRGRVAIVTLNRPESLNGFTTGLRNALKRELQAVAADDSVRAVVLTGAGRGFSAGADLKAEPMTSGATSSASSTRSTVPRCARSRACPSR